MNTPGIPRLTFLVDAVDAVLHRLRAHAAELVGEVAQYEDIYRYCYVRGPDGIIIGLFEGFANGASLPTCDELERSAGWTENDKQEE